VFFLIAAVLAALLLFHARLRRRTLFRGAQAAHWVMHRVTPHRAPPRTHIWRYQFNLNRGIGFLLARRSEMVRPVIYIALDWLFTILVLYYAFIAIHYKIALSQVIVGFAVGIVLSFASLIPGGLGVMEGSMAAVFASMQVPFETAVVAVLLFRVAYYLLPLLISLSCRRAGPGSVGNEIGRRHRRGADGSPPRGDAAGDGDARIDRYRRAQRQDHRRRQPAEADRAIADEDANQHPVGNAAGMADAVGVPSRRARWRPAPIDGVQRERPPPRDRHPPRRGTDPRVGAERRQQKGDVGAVIERTAGGRGGAEAARDAAVHRVAVGDDREQRRRDPSRCAVFGRDDREREERREGDAQQRDEVGGVAAHAAAYRAGAGRARLAHRAQKKRSPGCCCGESPPRG
jgi:hypothetical protein